MSFLPGSWRKWINRSGPFLNADNLNDIELKLRALDCLGAVRALGLVDALPGSPTDGDAYLTSATATPANKIVRRFDGAWEVFTPPNGMMAWLPSGSAKQFLSGAWVNADFGGRVASVFGRTGAVTSQTGDYTPEQVGAAPAVHTHAYIPTSQKGSANGVAELGADGRVPSGQLPSYVDDVLEYANPAAFPATGETGKIYVNLDQNKTWRWSGSAYVEISASLALGETSSTAYRGDRGKTAYDHSQLTTGNPHGTTAADVGALASANPNFTGNLLQDGDQRITPSGGGRFTDLSLATLAAGSDLPMVSDAAGVLRNKSAGAFRTIIAAAAADHNHFSKLEVSASTTIGSINASAIKVTTTDVILTLSGGVDGQGWDIICPTTSFGISIPAGVALYAYAGSDIGPTTRAVGGGRGIRIVRIDAATWIAPNMTW